MKRTVPLTNSELVERILPRVKENPDTGCWEWQGAGHARTGHGMVGYMLDGKSKVMYTHIVMWEHLVGPVPKGLVLDHLCRVTRCCNPQHMEPVTRAVNVLRGDSPNAVNARKTHCKRGHPLFGDNLYTRKDKPGRQCKQCGLDSNRRRYHERKHK